MTKVEEWRREARRTAKYIGARRVTQWDDVAVGSFRKTHSDDPRDQERKNLQLHGA